MSRGGDAFTTVASARAGVRGVDLVLAGVANGAVAGTALVVDGMSTSTGTIAFQSPLQAEVASELRDRAFVLHDIVGNVARLVSLAAAGPTADAIGIRAVDVVGAALDLAPAAVGLATPVPSGRGGRGRRVIVEQQGSADPVPVVSPLTDVVEPAGRR